MNRNGRLERHELVRIIKDLNLERLQCSELLIERFVEAEFCLLDTDGSGGIDLHEFTEYVTSMTRWMREELTFEANPRSVFALLASQAMLPITC